MAVLIDAHCHTVVAGELDAAAFELACTEAHLPAPAGTSYLDSQVGLAVRRWCAPALGLPRHAEIGDYLARRSAVGWRAATRTLLRSAGFETLLVDTGLDGPDRLDTATLGDLAGAAVREGVRLEAVAEHVASTGVDAAGFAAALAGVLERRTAHAVAVKSIIAYRAGLAVPAERPAAAEVRRAAGDWLRGGGGRLTDPVLLRHVLWAGVDTGLPLQVHTGFGDRDLALPAADPAHLQPFLGAVDGPVVLLHCYPYHRQAGWLAQVYPHVYLDVGLTVGHLGVRAGAVLAECFELAPFGKVLFSTDAYLLPELYLIGAAQFRHSLRRMLDAWRADDAISAADAARLTERVCAGTARRVYALAAGGQRRPVRRRSS
ncbi:amidohydrolase family protein [Dactylosporangium siamense]|uniref:amidohydrolase family protein n=1 Tax=Dactylosporangium siamense TaxID=685454 RepID=UPI00361867A4